MVNPLGSNRKKKKLCAIYYTVGNVDLKYRPQLKHIHMRIIQSKQSTTIHNHKTCDTSSTTVSSEESNVQGKTISRNSKVTVSALCKVSEVLMLRSCCYSICTSVKTKLHFFFSGDTPH